MAYTNKTVNYELPLYVGTDIPNPLTDWNGAMTTIDSTLKEQGDSVSSAVHDIDGVTAIVGDTHLDTVAQTVTGAVNELNSADTALDSRLTGAEADIAGVQSGLVSTNSALNSLSNNVTGMGTRIVALENQNGDTPLATTAQTLSGAINELDGDCVNLDSRVTVLENSPVATIDTEMSDDSTNAVQNKVIKDYVDTADNGIRALINTVASEARGETVRGVITAGQTSGTLTFADIIIGATSYISVYTDTFGVNPTDVQYTSNTVTITIEEQAEDVGISAMVINR